MIIKEQNSVWDADKAMILATAPTGAFDFDIPEIGTHLDHEWWKLTSDENSILGYGWVDFSEGDAELSVIICDTERGNENGSALVNAIVDDLIARGYTEVVGIVSSKNLNAKRVLSWLSKMGFRFFGILDQELTVQSAQNWSVRLDVKCIKQLTTTPHVT